MAEKSGTQTFAIVAFRYDRHHSLAYQNAKTSQDVAIVVQHALDDLKADVISIRRVYQKCPIPT